MVVFEILRYASILNSTFRLHMNRKPTLRWILCAIVPVFVPVLLEPPALGFVLHRVKNPHFSAWMQFFYRGIYIYFFEGERGPRSVGSSSRPVATRGPIASKLGGPNGFNSGRYHGRRSARLDAGTMRKKPYPTPPPLCKAALKLKYSSKEWWSWLPAIGSFCSMFASWKLVLLYGLWRNTAFCHCLSNFFGNARCRRLFHFCRKCIPSFDTATFMSRWLTGTPGRFVQVVVYFVSSKA